VLSFRALRRVFQSLTYNEDPILLVLWLVETLWFGILHLIEFFGPVLFIAQILPIDVFPFQTVVRAPKC